MAEAGLFIGWGEVVRGREKRALKLFNEAMQYWGVFSKKSRSSALTWPFLHHTVEISAASSCCGGRSSRSTRFAVTRSFSGGSPLCSS